MRIGLNGQRLLIDELAGPEIYTLNLFKAFAEIDQENEYVIYFDKKPPEGFFEDISHGNPNFTFKVLEKPQLPVKISKLVSWTQMLLAWELIKNPVDVFFTATHTLPGLTTIATLGKFKAITMIHGLEYKTNNEFVNKPTLKAIHPFVLWWTAVMSKKIIVPSGATKQAILSEEWTGITGDKITVIPEGVNKTFYKRPEEEIRGIRQKYNLGSGKYLLFVSTIQPRKNIPLLVAGFSDALKELQNDPKNRNITLLLVGKKGWMYQESYLAPKKYGVESEVKFLGRVPDADLPILLSGATGFVSTSTDEGFGLPLLEAMACETPTLVSDIPAFREVGENFPIYVEPNNRTSIRKGLLELIKMAVNEKVIKNAKRRADTFAWTKTANATLSILEEIGKGSSPSK